MAAGTYDLSPINAGDPIRYNQLANIYKILDNTLQPSFSNSDGAIQFDSLNGLSDLFTFTSTSFVEISPKLTITFAHEIARNVMCILPIWWNIATATTVAQIGIQVDGVLDTTSIIQMSSNAVVSTAQPQMFTSFMFALASDVNHPYDFAPSPVGSYTIKPVVKIVSGAAGQINIRLNRSTRFIVKEI